MTPCPWCGAKAVDVTTTQDLQFDQRRVFICTGDTCHEWRDGDAPEPDQEPLVVLA